MHISKVYILGWIQVPTDGVILTSSLINHLLHLDLHSITAWCRCC